MNLSYILIIILSLAAIYHAHTYALWLWRDGNKKGAKGVYLLVFLALGLLII